MKFIAVFIIILLQMNNKLTMKLKHKNNIKQNLRDLLFNN